VGSTFAFDTHGCGMNLRALLFLFILTIQQIVPPNVSADDLGEALQVAIAKEDVESVKRIAFQIKNMDSVKNWVGTPLHNAAYGRSLEIIKILVENGADINAKNEEGGTPFHFAAYTASMEIIKYFVEEKKVNINQADKEGKKPIHYSAFKGSVPAVKYLVDHGANANAKDFDSATPLHKAASCGSLALVKYLVESQGADVNAIEKRHGFTPIHWAAWSKSLDMVKYLIGSGSNLNLRDYRGDTILHIAAYSGAIDVVRYLVEERHVKTDVMNYNKHSPIDVAVEKQNGDIVKYLSKQKESKVRRP
jgi:ankyrin repeat protein